MSNINTEFATSQPVKQLLDRLLQREAKADAMEQDIVEFTKNGKLPDMSPDRISHFLATCPDMIAQCERDTAFTERDYLYAKNDTATIRAQLWNQANLPGNREKYNLSNAEDRKCWVQVQDAFQARQKIEYEWKCLLARETAILNKYNNIFTAYRKIANLVELDQTNVYRQEKYNT